MVCLVPFRRRRRRILLHLRLLFLLMMIVLQWSETTSYSPISRTSGFVQGGRTQRDSRFHDPNGKKSHPNETVNTPTVTNSYSSRTEERPLCKPYMETNKGKDNRSTNNDIAGCHSKSRRQFGAFLTQAMSVTIPTLSTPTQPLLSSSTCVPSTRLSSLMVTLGGITAGRPDPAVAANKGGPLPSLFDRKQRRQLDLCIVILLRLLGWAESEAAILADSEPDKRKSGYLESRLAAKAALTGRIGGGASLRVFDLASFQLRDCLDDVAWYAKSKEVDRLRVDLVESLADIVEFDGLETTIDPSPRSTLMLSMYNEDKATYVRRMLAERVVPTTRAMIEALDPDVRERSVAYVQSMYPADMPKSFRRRSIDDQ